MFLKEAFEMTDMVKQFEASVANVHNASQMLQRVDIMRELQKRDVRLS